MQAHDKEHESLLERILVGDLPRGAAQAVAQLRACAECRERLEGFDKLQASLERAGEEERAGVAQAGAAELPAKDARRIEEFVSARVAAERARSKTSRWIALALAASLVGVVAYRPVLPKPEDGGAGGGRDVPLGADTSPLWGISPRGSVRDFGAFSWRSPPLRSGETFRLRITNLDAPDTEPLEIDNIERAEWSREDDAGILEAGRIKEFFDRAPRNIEWVFEIVSANQRVQVSDSVPASLR